MEVAYLGEIPYPSPTMLGAFLLSIALVGAPPSAEAPTPAEQTVIKQCDAEMKASRAAYAAATQPGASAQRSQEADAIFARLIVCAETDDPASAAEVYRWRMYLWNRLGGTSRVASLSAEYLDRFGPDVSLAGFVYVVELQSNALVAAGRAPDALESLYATLEQLPDTAHAFRADLMTRMARTYSFVSEFDRSLDLHEESIAYMHRTLSPSEANVRIARIQALMADALLLRYSSTDQPKEVSLQRARRHALQALQYSSRSSSGGDHAFNLLVYGEVLSYLGNVATADSALSAAIRIGEERGEASLTRSARFKLGRHALATGRYELAERELMAAYVSTTLQPDQVVRQHIATDIGLLHERLDDPTTARAWYEESIGLTERFRGYFDASQWSATSMSGWQAPYRGLARIALQSGESEKALRIIDRAQARNLRTMHHQLQTASTRTGGRAAELDSLMSRLEMLRTVQRSEWADGSGASFPNQTDGEIVQLRQKITRFMGERREPESLRLESVQQGLARQQSAAVVYFADRLDPLYSNLLPMWAIVVQPSSVTAYRLPITTESIVGDLRRVSAMFATPDAPADLNAQAFSLDALHTLYTSLFAPLADELESVRSLIIIPDGPLHAVPFAALPIAPPSGFGYRDTEYLSDRFALTHDLALALPTYATSETPRGALVVGVSGFTGSGMPDLPGVSREIKAVHASLRGSAVLLDGDATPSALRDAVSNHSILHLATHTIVSAASPLYHRFLLREGDRVAPLHLYEIERLRLDTELVVLSSCASGQGRYRTGEGLMSLQYAFRSIGARSTLANLWNADDAVTADLMTHFYDALSDGQPRDRALQIAQQRIRRDNPDASPYVWAASVLSGNSATLALPPSSMRLVPEYRRTRLNLSPSHPHLHPTTPCRNLNSSTKSSASPPNNVIPVRCN